MVAPEEIMVDNPEEPLEITEHAVEIGETLQTILIYPQGQPSDERLLAHLLALLKAADLLTQHQFSVPAMLKEKSMGTPTLEIAWEKLAMLWRGKYASPSWRRVFIFCLPYCEINQAVNPVEFSRAQGHLFPSGQVWQEDARHVIVITDMPTASRRRQLDGGIIRTGKGQYFLVTGNSSPTGPERLKAFLSGKKELPSVKPSAPAIPRPPVASHQTAATPRIVQPQQDLHNAPTRPAKKPARQAPPASPPAPYQTRVTKPPSSDVPTTSSRPAGGYRVLPEELSAREESMVIVPPQHRVESWPPPAGKSHPPPRHSGQHIRPGTEVASQKEAVGSSPTASQEPFEPSKT